MARLLSIDKDAVFGKLIRFWAWIDKNSVDGVVDGVVDADVDKLCFQNGFAHALAQVGWIHIDAVTERLTIPKFDRHNGESAKKRALKSERQARWRENCDPYVDNAPSTKASTREEKRRSKTLAPNGAFEQFWNAYPKKRSKDQALKAFAKINPDEQLLSAMLAAVKQAETREDWKRDGGQFIPYAATWLNAGGWKDEDPAQPKLRVAM